LLDNVAEPDAKTALERVDQLVFGVNVQRRTFAGAGLARSACVPVWDTSRVMSQDRP
jgi:hypothetical protein